MSFEGNPLIEEDQEKMRIEQELLELKQHPEWSKIYKNEMSTYGSADYRNVIEMEYKKDLESGEVTFKEALKDYTEKMAARVLRMKVKMKKIDEEDRRLYGDKRK